MPKSFVNHYEKLQVPQNATNEEIIRKFRELSKLYHPDRPNGNATKFIEITEAKDFLLNPTKRRELDNDLRKNSEKEKTSNQKKSYNNNTKSTFDREERRSYTNNTQSPSDRESQLLKEIQELKYRINNLTRDNNNLNHTINNLTHENNIIKSQNEILEQRQADMQKVEDNRHVNKYLHFYNGCALFIILPFFAILCIAWIFKKEYIAASFVILAVSIILGISINKKKRM